ncbi:MAG TPA: hypothetical protein PLP42_00095 [Acidobacteriota bacterium]|jgi:tetratricopeptide (TPR) repeat protein|nr:hypothetical protein [Acidobacteriota bacterium]
MGLLKRVFEKAWGRDTGQVSGDGINADAAFLDLHEYSNRNIYFGKESWICSNSDSPGQLSEADRFYSSIIEKIDQLSGREIREAARRLWSEEPDSARSCCLMAYGLRLSGRPAEAEETLKAWMRRNGEDAVFLIHLARLYAESGDQPRAELTLWRALKLDPNEIHAVEWFTSIHRERFGQSEYLRALEQLTSFPGSWRPQLWLAQALLEDGQFDKARRYYQHALSVLDEVPSEVMMSISEALGNAGRIVDIITLLGDRFKPEIHGLRVASNLLRAYLELKDPEKALEVLRQLFALKRPEWAEQLRYWAEQIDSQLASQTKRSSSKASPVSVLTLENPVWAHHLANSNLLLPPKGDKAVRIAFLSCSFSGPAESTGTSEGDDRWTRLVPLFLAEQVHMLTTARCLALVTIKTGGSGFYVATTPFGKQALRKMGHKVDADFVVHGHIDAGQTPWEITLNLESVEDSGSSDALVGSLQPSNPGNDLLELSRRIQRMILKEAGVHRSLRPIDYRLPLGECFNSYLDGLCDSLTLSAAVHNWSPGLLYDERSLLDRLLNLALEDTSSDVARLMFVGALAKSKASGSGVFSHYESSARKLLQDYPLTGIAAQSAEATLNEL